LQSKAASIEIGKFLSGCRAFKLHALIMA
jgi:hypothetical protein